MNQVPNSERSDELRSEYDFSGGVGGKHYEAYRKGLLLARDPFGIKPLYYRDDGATLYAASQVKALLTGGPIETTPEPAEHVGFYLWGHVPEPYTLYQGIRALPAGTSLWLEGTGRHPSPAGRNSGP